MREKDYSKKILTIPNILSLFRLALAFLFLVLYLGAESRRDYLTALGVLVISACTDVIDGRIARRFHMVSNVGKLLDPVADKVTQAFVMLALISRYPLMVLEMGIFVMKECYMGLMGLKVMKETGWNEGALWYGKLNTVILYGTSILLVFFFDMPHVLADVMIGVCCISILFCMWKYHLEFRRVLREHREGKEFLGD